MRTGIICCVGFALLLSVLLSAPVTGLYAGPQDLGPWVPGLDPWIYEMDRRFGGIDRIYVH
jgi:hypothetical protein